MEALAAEGAGLTLGLILLWYILQVIADWKILSKAGKPGILSLIPFVNVCAEYSVCWSGFMGVLYMVFLSASTALSQKPDAPQSMVIAASVLGLFATVIHIVQSFKLAKSFGKGFGTGLLLLLFGPLGRLVLGLGSSRYVGKA